MRPDRSARDQAFLLVVATELCAAVKRRGVQGAEELLREAIRRARLEVPALDQNPKIWGGQ
jgi:hypothetical protein